MKSKKPVVMTVGEKLCQMVQLLNPNNSVMKKGEEGGKLG